MIKYFKKYASKIYIHMIYILYERPRGLDFIRQYDAFSRSNSSAFMYSITTENALKQIFSDMQISVDDVILDIGCGKGFTLFCMAKLGFKHIRGIELLPILVEIAKRNISILKLDDIISVNCADATSYEKYDDYKYIYMYNPFPIKVMEMVIKNIENSLKRKRRNLTIIYTNPTCHEAIIKSDLIEFYKKRFCDGRFGGKWEVNYYKSKIPIEN